MSFEVVVLLPRLDGQVTLPAALDGSGGSNRAYDSTLLAANTDREAIVAWLADIEVENTFSSYRREAERLWLWAPRALGQPLSSLTHEDMRVYGAFLLDPQPAHIWMSNGGDAGGRKFPRSDSRWRPFYTPLSRKSQKLALSILNAMFSWFVEAGYLKGNPLSLSRRRTRGKQVVTREKRYLPPRLWEHILEYVESMPRGTKMEVRRYRRARWLITLFFLGGLRISEVVSNTMGDFRLSYANDGTPQWWLDVMGKGDKAREVPATSEMMDELAAYRMSFDLPPVPRPDESTPLVLRYGETGLGMTRSSLHVAVKQILDGAAGRLEASGVPAALLRKASAHWLRHTAGSSMADRNIDLRMVRDHLGHESISTTNIYLHTDEDMRHKETEAKFRVGWNKSEKPTS